jgi:hypothetical protein
MLAVHSEFCEYTIQDLFMVTMLPIVTVTM